VFQCCLDRHLVNSRRREIACLIWYGTLSYPSLVGNALVFALQVDRPTRCCSSLQWAVGMMAHSD
jgi:hypothetical protein